MTPKTYRIDLTKKEWLLNIFILFVFFYGIFAKNIFALLFSVGMFTIINILSCIRLGIKNYYFSLSTRDIDWKKRLTAEELEVIEDIKEVFVNYINFNPDYFRSFVPYRYFKKN